MSLTSHPLDDVIAAAADAADVAAVRALATGGVFNDVPQDTPRPYVVLRGRAKPIGPMAGNSVWEIELEAAIYSDYAGDHQALLIAGAVGDQLDQKSLVVAGWTMIGAVVLEDLYPLDDHDFEGQAIKQWVLLFRLHVERA